MDVVAREASAAAEEAEAARQAEAKLNDQTIQQVLEGRFPYLYEGIKAVKKLNKLEEAQQTETLDFFYKDESIKATDQTSLKGAIDGINNSPLLKKDFSGSFNSEVKNMLSDLEVYNEPQLKNLFNKLILSMNGLAGAFVKIWDSPKDKHNIKDATINVNYGEKKITINDDPDNSICNLEQQTYGPFKGVFDRNNDEIREPMTNTDVFKFIKYEYKMFEQIGFDKDETIEAKVIPRNFRLFAFGYSGSGKTYTLIQGTQDDPSVLANTLEYLYMNGLEREITLSIKIYYPLTNETIDVNDDKITAKISALSLSGINYGEKVNDLINSVENYMIENLYTVPTTNNPNSSRAFTLYTIGIDDNMGKIYFTDMPGNEKTSLIKNDFLFTDEFITKLNRLNIKKQQFTYKDFARQIFSNDVVEKKMEEIYQIHCPRNKQTLFPKEIEVENEKRTVKKRYIELGNLKKSEFIIFLDNPIYPNIKEDEKTGLSQAPGGTDIFSEFIKVYLQVNESVFTSKAAYYLTERTYGTDKITVYSFFNPFFIDVMELINQKIKGEIKSLNKGDFSSNRTYILPSQEMMRDFVNAFKTKIKNLLENTKKSLEATEYPSYDLRKTTITKKTNGKTVTKKLNPSSRKQILKKVFNKVFNPCLNKDTKNVDYSISEGPRLFQDAFIKEILTSQVGKELILRINTTNVTINKFKNVLSPIIYLYIIILNILEGPDDTSKKLRENFNIVGKSPAINLFKFYFTYRVIDFITTQGDYINTALENHKFVFLKRSNFFKSTECKEGLLEDKKTTILDYIPPYKLVHNQTESNPCTDIVGDTGKIKFKKQDYKINVTIGSGNNKLVLTEKIRREYLPVMNELLYGENDKVEEKMKEKFITLIAIKRLEEDGNEAKQKARCDYAQESLDFADQISGNSKSVSGGNYLKYNKKRKSKKNKRSNKRKQSKKRKIIRM